MSIKVTKLIKLIKQKYTIFNNLSENDLLKSLQVFRLLELREMESIRIIGGESNDYLCLILGCIEVIDSLGNSTTIKAHNGCNKPFLMPPFPSGIVIKAIDDSYLCHIDVDMLDYLLSMEIVKSCLTSKEDHLRVLIDKVKHFPVFRNIPLQNVIQAINNVREIDAERGEEIIKFGDTVETFYVLTSGSAEVLMPSGEDCALCVCSKMRAGDGFGEEALVGSDQSEFTVRMAEAGTLLALDKKNFKELFEKPLVLEVEPQVAKAMIENGYKLLDVRLEDEHEISFIPNSMLMPLYDLKQRINELDKSKSYVVYCRSGRRSSAAAYILKKYDINALSLRGGIITWPYDIVVNGYSFNSDHYKYCNSL